MTEDRASSFDELARGLASGSLSRGKALKLMGAALVGGALASLGMGEAGADECKRDGKVCKKNTQCCSGNCVKSSGSATGVCTAACPAGQVMCGGSCVSTTCRDPGQTFNTTTCQCEPTGTFEYSCLCEDETFFSACRSIECSDESRLAVCAPLCEPHGGIHHMIFPGCSGNEPVCGGTPA